MDDSSEKNIHCGNYIMAESRAMNMDHTNVKHEQDHSIGWREEYLQRRYKLIA